jgi:large subunit ribosomal protein L10
MSKYVKNLISEELSKRLSGESECLLVNVVGLDANKTMTLRRELRSKDIQLIVVKNSLARRATTGSPLACAFEDLEGPVAVAWGSEDVVSLAKEIVRLGKDSDYEGFVPRGGVMDQVSLTPEQVREVSKWPSRTEQLSLLVGQILAPGSNLAAQLIGTGGELASQIEQHSAGESKPT